METSKNQQLFFPLSNKENGKARIEFEAYPQRYGKPQGKFNFISHLPNVPQICLFERDMNTLVEELPKVLTAYLQTENELLNALQQRADDISAGHVFTDYCFPQREFANHTIQENGDFFIKLVVNTYQDKVFFWLARYMKPKGSAPNDEKLFRCKGGSRMNLVDPAKLKAFVDKCLKSL